MIYRNHSPVRSVAFLSLTICIATACTFHQTSGPAKSSGPYIKYELPATIHWSEHWSKTSAVDLTSADGTFIRAYTEADQVRVWSSVSRSYPGFILANQTGEKASFDSGDEYGYLTHWVASFTKSSDMTTAIVCTLNTIGPDSHNLPAPFLDMLTLTYKQTGNSPPTDQHGPRRAPVGSVFGDWFATDSKWVNSDSPLTPCLSNQPPIDKGPVSTPGWPEEESR